MFPCQPSGKKTNPCIKFSTLSHSTEIKMTTLRQSGRFAFPPGGIWPLLSHFSFRMWNPTRQLSKKASSQTQSYVTHLFVFLNSVTTIDCTHCTFHPSSCQHAILIDFPQKCKESKRPHPRAINICGLAAITSSHSIFYSESHNSHYKKHVNKRTSDHHGDVWWWQSS